VEQHCWARLARSDRCWCMNRTTLFFSSCFLKVKQTNQCRRLYTAARRMHTNWKRRLPTSSQPSLHHQVTIALRTTGFFFESLLFVRRHTTAVCGIRVHIAKRSLQNTQLWWIQRRNDKRYSLNENAQRRFTRLSMNSAHVSGVASDHNIGRGRMRRQSADVRRESSALWFSSNSSSSFSF
jgi:hypothetical protein